MPRVMASSSQFKCLLGTSLLYIRAAYVATIMMASGSVTARNTGARVALGSLMSARFRPAMVDRARSDVSLHDVLRSQRSSNEEVEDLGENCTYVYNLICKGTAERASHAIIRHGSIQ